MKLQSNFQTIKQLRGVRSLNFDRDIFIHSHSNIACLNQKKKTIHNFHSPTSLQSSYIIKFITVISYLLFVVVVLFIYLPG